MKWPGTSVCNREPSRGSRRCSENARYWQRGNQHSLITLGPQLWRQLIGYMPGENDRAFGLVDKQPALFNDRYRRARHAFADLQRPFNFANIVDDGFVQSNIIDQ